VLELAPDPLRSGVTAHLMALVRKELVRPDRATFAGEEAFRFRHLLIRDAAYQAMPKETRAELHERFAGWLERVAGDRAAEYEEILAYHLEQAFRFREELGPVDDGAREVARRAAAHLQAAGRRAGARGDYPAARNLLDRARELLPDGDAGRLGIQAQLGHAMFESGEIEAAHELLARTEDAARAAGDRGTEAWALVYRLEVAASIGMELQATVITQAAEAARTLESLGDEAGYALAMSVVGQFLFFTGHAGEAVATLEQVRERAERLGLTEQAQQAAWWIQAGLFFGPTPASEGEARLEALLPLTRGSATAEAAYLRAKSRFAWIQGRFDEARECLTRWEAIERDLGRRTRLASVHGHYLGPLELAAGNYEAAVASGRRGFEEQSALGDRGYSATAAGQLAHALLASGEDEEAERYAREAFDRSASDDLEPKISGGGALAVALARRGELSEAERVAREAVALARETDYAMNLAVVLVDLARVLALKGEPDEAQAAVHEAVEILERKEAWALADRAREVAAAL